MLTRKTIVTVGGGWAWPALIDFESKAAEAALCNVFISDLRNFGHGRHHWFDKRGSESALLVIETQQFELLAKRTLTLLPPVYPRAVLRSAFEGPMAGLDLLIQVFHLVWEMGKRVGIDPGRPRVPEFGRRIYGLGLTPVLSGRKPTNRAAWVTRKTRATGISTSIVESHLEEFLVKLRKNSFAAVVFDYDGTLCDPPERFTKPKAEIGDALNRLLSRGITVGVATGRGRSVQKGLREIIDPQHWCNVIIGNYNGSVVQPLTSEPSRFDPENLSVIIRKAQEALINELVLIDRKVEFDIRERQISISPVPPLSMRMLLELVLDSLKIVGQIKILQSDHSIDVIDPEVSKILLVEAVRGVIGQSEKNNILVIGDQGDYRGNDSEMLSGPYSLSVNKISTSLSTCWNLSPVGARGARATFAILEALRVANGVFQIDMDFLEKAVVR